MFTLFRIKARLSRSNHRPYRRVHRVSPSLPCRRLSEHPYFNLISRRGTVPPRRLHSTKTLQRKYIAVWRRPSIFLSVFSITFLRKLPSARFLVTVFPSVVASVLQCERCTDIPLQTVRGTCKLHDYVASNRRGAYTYTVYLRAR